MLSLKWVCWIPTAHTSLCILLHSKVFCGNGILPETHANLACVPVYCWMKLFNHIEIARRSLINGWDDWAWDFLCLCLVFNFLLSLRDVNKPQVHGTIANIITANILVDSLASYLDRNKECTGGGRQRPRAWLEAAALWGFCCSLSIMTHVHGIFKAASRPMLFSAGTDCTN
jgi:hypothetical protein